VGRGEIRADVPAGVCRADQGRRRRGRCAGWCGAGIGGEFAEIRGGRFADGITAPIAMRLQGSTKAMQHGVGAGVGLGVVIGVLCPPLLPISAGGAVLAAMRAWRVEMKAAEDLNATERAQRIADLKQERAAALRQLTQGAAALQMETEDLSVTVDADNGTADAVVLKGKHVGRLWSDLSAVEKLEVADTLVSGASILLNILEIGKES
jgi:hypothetical protein